MVAKTKGQINNRMEVGNVEHSTAVALVEELISAVDYLGRWHCLPGSYIVGSMSTAWVRFGLHMDY